MTTSRTIYILAEGDDYHLYEHVRAFTDKARLVAFLQKENRQRTTDKWKLVEGESQKWTDGTFRRWIEKVPLEE